MANPILIKRSSVAAKVPLTTDLQLGELAINTNDGKLFLLKNNGTASIVEVGAASAPVQSVAGRTGAVVLTSADVSGVATSGANSNITSLTGLTTALSVAQGGTGTTTATGTGATVRGTSPTFNGQVVFPQASAANPSITLSGDLTTGIYTNGTGSFSIAAGGVSRVTYTNTASTFVGSVVAPTPATSDSSTTVATTAFVKAVAASTAGAANGTATLDATAKLTASQIPTALVGTYQYQGTFDPTANTPALSSGVGTKGQSYKVSAATTTGIKNVIANTTVNLGGGTNVTSVQLATTPGALVVGTKLLINGQVVTVTALNSPSANYETFTPAATFANGAAVQAYNLTSLDGINTMNVGDFVAFNGTTWDRIIGPALSVTDISGAAPLASPTFTGTVTAPFVNSGVNAAIAAAGTTQATGTALTTSVNVVTSGTGGVVLPSGVAGMLVTVINTTGAAINVYPAVGAQIDAMAANTAFSLGTVAKLEFVAVSATQWYALTAVYA
jgi:hypothetical protein